MSTVKVTWECDGKILRWDMERHWFWGDYETLYQRMKQQTHCFVEIYAFPKQVELPLKFIVEAKKYLAKPLSPAAIMICRDPLTHGTMEMLKAFCEMKQYPHRLSVTHDESKGYAMAQAWLDANV